MKLFQLVLPYLRGLTLRFNPPSTIHVQFGLKDYTVQPWTERYTDSVWRFLEADSRPDGKHMRPGLKAACPEGQNCPVWPESSSPHIRTVFFRTGLCVGVVRALFECVLFKIDMPTTEDLLEIAVIVYVIANGKNGNRNMWMNSLLEWNNLFSC